MLRWNKQHKHDLSEIETARTHFFLKQKNQQRKTHITKLHFSSKTPIIRESHRESKHKWDPKDPKKERLRKCSLIKTYSASGRNRVRADIIRRPIFAFNTKASREASHAVDDLQQRDPNSLRIEKRLQSFMWDLYDAQSINPNSHSIGLKPFII